MQFLILFIFSLFINLSTSMAATPQQPTLAEPTSDQIFDYLQLHSARSIADWEGQGDMRNARDFAWRWGAGVAEAATEMYIATGERRFLTLTLDGCSTLLAKRDVDLGLSDAPTWGSLVRTSRDDSTPRARKPEVTMSGIVFHACLRALRISEDASSQLTNTFTEKALAAWRFHASNDCHADGDVEACFLPTGIEPLNHVANYGAMLIQLYRLEKSEDLREDIEGIVKLFHKCMRHLPDGSYNWDYRPTIEQCNDPDYVPEGEPLWKTRSTFLLPLTAYKNGFDFTEGDMESVAKVFHHIVRGNVLCKKITPNSCRELKGEPYQRSTIALWMRLAPFDGSIQDDLVQLMAEREDLFPSGWMTSVWTVQAYALYREQLED